MKPWRKPGRQIRGKNSQSKFAETCAGDFHEFRRTPLKASPQIRSAGPRDQNLSDEPIPLWKGFGTLAFSVGFPSASPLKICTFTAWKRTRNRTRILPGTALGVVPTTPAPNTSPKVSRYKWAAYRDTNWWCMCYFLPRGGHTLQKYCDRNGRCMAILFQSIRVRGRCAKRTLQATLTLLGVT